MNRFRLSRRAETDIAEIRHYIAQDNATAADAFVGELFDLFQLLGRNPEIGQQRQDLRPNLRSISHGNYAVFSTRPTMAPKSPQLFTELAISIPYSARAVGNRRL